MTPNPHTVKDVAELSRATNDHFGLLLKEVLVHLDDFSERVKAAEAGDEIAGMKLLKYLRGCLMLKKLPDPLVADWAANCIFEIAFHGINPNKAFSLKPETGRPKHGGEDLVNLVTWECSEKIRIENNLSKLDAIAIYQEQRHSLARRMETLGEKGTWEEISTLEKRYRKGANLVKRYLEETGK